MAKKKAQQEGELPGMPLGNVPKSVRDTAEKYIAEKLELARQKDVVISLEEKLLLEMTREKCTVAIVIQSHKKYYVRLEHKSDKIKVQVGPVIPLMAVSNGNQK